MIKSKIDARERALEFVVSLHLHDRELIRDLAQEFTDFLIGDAELPEAEPSVEEITTNALQKITALYQQSESNDLGIVGGFKYN